MERDSLQAFLVLADTLHFARASRLSHMTPSTLSRIIQRLEDEVGYPLFERTKRQVSLTYAGQRFKIFARQALESWEEFRDELNPTNNNLQGEISLYCSVTACYSILPDLLSPFRKNHPLVKVKLETGDPELALEKVQTGKADISLAPQPPLLPAGLIMKRVRETPLVAIAPKKVEGQHKKANSSHLSDFPFILPEAGVARQLVDQWFQQQHLEPQIYGQVAGNEAILALVAAGCGIGIVPQIVLERSPLKNKVREIPMRPALPKLGISICMRQRKISSPITLSFWQLSIKS